MNPGELDVYARAVVRDHPFAWESDHLLLALRRTREIVGDASLDWRAVHAAVRRARAEAALDREARLLVAKFGAANKTQKGSRAEAREPLPKNGTRVPSGS